jgi:plastocyanin
MRHIRRRAAITVVLAGIVVSSCGGGGGGGAYGGATAPTAAAGNTSDSSTAVVGILGDRGAQSFAPNPVTAKVGQKVAWRNQDGTVHRIVQDSAGNTNSGDGYGPGGSAPDAVFDGGETGPGATSSAMSLSAAGTIRYHCLIHPSMVGTIVVQ